MAKPIVLIAEELSPATVDALGPDFDIRHLDGTDRPALLAALADASAILIRSATKLDAEAIAAGKNLKVIARAGVGLDNVDVKSATTAGVMVVNAPTSNIVSAAELAIGHLLALAFLHGAGMDHTVWALQTRWFAHHGRNALARHIPDANHSAKAGEWTRSKFTGTELFDKTIGIIGLGRIGTLVAQRLAGFDVKLVAFDPYVTPIRAQQLGVQLASLNEVMEQSDFITIHIPKTPETVGMIGTDEFALAKPSLRIVNCSRGGIIDEGALFQALSSKRIAGAALDVFVNEPPTDSPDRTRPERPDR